MLKKKEKRMEPAITLYMLMGALCPVIVMADPGLNVGWFWSNFKLAVLVVSVGLAIMFFIQKATARMITTLVVGGFLYVIASAPEATFTAIGGLVKSILGL